MEKKKNITWLEHPVVEMDVIKYVTEQTGMSDFAVETVLNAANKYREDFRFACCGVCGKVLKGKELLNLRHDHFYRTCEDHLKYAGYYQLDQIRDELGIKFRGY